MKNQLDNELDELHIALTIVLIVLSGAMSILC